MMTTIGIKGMSCKHCVQAVSKALQDLPGLSKVEINLETGTASLDHDDSLDITLVKDRIQKAGYEVV
jgi:copper chaperone